MPSARRRLVATLTVLSLTLALAFPAGAAQSPGAVAAPGATAEDAVAAEGGIDLWFVELSGPPTIDGGSAADAKGEKQAFRDAAKARGISFGERYAYDDLFNGLSIAATGDAIAQIRGLPGVKAIWPVVAESIPRSEPTDGEVLDLATAIQMTGANYVQDTLGITGRNVKVAVMDTGIDYHHPDLGGCFQPLDDDGPCRVIRGFDFVGNAFTGSASTPVPDDDPDDCNGHGTHVSGIIGANGAVKGVAPGVKFGAYRVFGCDGSTTVDIMLAAMEMALHDNMDVLNMSIGSSFQWPQYPTGAAADRLVTKKGMVVVASIGNNGPGASSLNANGLYSAGAPGVGANVIGVASFDNTHLAQTAFAASPDGKLIGYNLASATTSGPPVSGSLPLTAVSPVEGCPTPAAPVPPSIGTSPHAPGSLTGKAVLIKRGPPAPNTCGFYLKAIHAQQAGAAAVILYNNVAGPLNPTVAAGTGQPQVTIPVVAITIADGNLLAARLAGGPVTITWTDQTVSAPIGSANRISGFSSFGVAADLSLKPDIGAPGGNIRSTWPVELGSYANISGTSMSSPHVAGAVALYLEANRSQKPPTVRDVLQNSASPRPSFSVGGNFESTHRQGAGMLDIRAAIEASALVLPGKLSLGESEFGPVTRTLTIENTGKEETLTFTLSHAPAAATGPSTFLPVTSLDSPVTVTFSAPSVTVQRNTTATVDVTIAPNAALANKSLYGGFIFLTASDGSVYRVPYSGFKGDYQSIQVLTGLTGLGRLNAMGACCLLVPPASSTFTLANAAGTPNFLVHFHHQSRRVTFTVKDVATGVTLAEPAITLEFVPRNTTATGIFAFAWDGAVGTTTRTPVPDGTYQISIQVLKALGDPANPAHTETAVLGTLTIDRP